MKQPQIVIVSEHLENSSPEYEAYSCHLGGPMTAYGTELPNASHNLSQVAFKS